MSNVVFLWFSWDWTVTGFVLFEFFNCSILSFTEQLLTTWSHLLIRFVTSMTMKCRRRLWSSSIPIIHHPSLSSSSIQCDRGARPQLPLCPLCPPWSVVSTPSLGVVVVWHLVAPTSWLSGFISAHARTIASGHYVWPLQLKRGFLSRFWLFLECYDGNSLRRRKSLYPVVVPSRWCP